jgi:hypothetical protein
VPDNTQVLATVPRVDRGAGTESALSRPGSAALQVLLVALVLPTHDLLSGLWHALSPWIDAVAAVAACAATAVLWLRAVSPLRPYRLPVAAFAAVSVLSVVVNNVHWMHAVGGLRALLPWMVVGLSAAAVFRPADVPGVLKVAVGMGAGVAVYGIASYLTFRYLGGPFNLPPEPGTPWEQFALYPYRCGAYVGGWRLSSTFMNDNYCGVWLAMLTPIGFVLLLDEQRRWVRIARGVGLGLMLLALTWTYSRSAALALLVAVTVLTLRVSRWAPALLLPVLVAAPLFTLPVDEYRFQQLGATQGGRIESVQRTRDLLWRKPVLGQGPGTRGLADMNYAKIGFETGFLGLAIFGWLLLVAARPALQLNGSSGVARRLQGGMLAALTAVAAAALGGEVWEMPQIACYFWIFAGLIGVLGAVKASEPPTPAERIECAALT